MWAGNTPLNKLLPLILGVLVFECWVENWKVESAQFVHGHIPVEELENEPWDVVILGGGPAGTGAGCASRLLGKKRVLLIHDSSAPLGTIAPNQGAPSGLFSKALRDAAKTLDVSVLQSLGLSQRVIWAQVREMTERLAAEGSHRGTFLMLDLGVQVVRGRGRLVSDNEIAIQLLEGYEAKVEAKRVVIATGSRARSISAKSLDDTSVFASNSLSNSTKPRATLSTTKPSDETRVFTSDTISQLMKLPTTVTISGSGIIGIEFAKIFSLFGSNVTMVVRGLDPRVGLVRKGMDLDVANELVEDLSRNGVSIRNNVTATSLRTRNREDGVYIELSDGTKISSDIFLSATGQVPNTEGLGLKDLGVEMDRGGHIKVNENLQTSVRSIFGVGDALGSPALASTADIQGHAAIGHAFLTYGDEQDDLPVEGLTVLRAMMDALHTIRTVGYPVCVWTIPEVSYYGYTKASARDAGFSDAQEAVASYSSCFRGRVFSPQGFLKLIYQESTGRVLGVHIIGEDACEMIHFGMQLVQGNRTLVEIMSQPFTAVTFHELYMWAARIAVMQGFARQMIWQKVQSYGICSDDASHEAPLEEVFASIDLNHDRRISGSELADALSDSGGVFGIVWTGMQLISLLIEPNDEDNSKDLSFEEFKAMATGLIQGP